MTKHATKLMGIFRQKLEKYVGMEMTHCGHEVPMMEAAEERDKLEMWLEDEIDKLIEEIIELK